MCKIQTIFRPLSLVFRVSNALLLPLGCCTLPRPPPFVICLITSFRLRSGFPSPFCRKNYFFQRKTKRQTNFSLSFWTTMLCLEKWNWVFKGILTNLVYFKWSASRAITPWTLLLAAFHNDLSQRFWHGLPRPDVRQQHDCSWFDLIRITKCSSMDWILDNKVNALTDLFARFTAKIFADLLKFKLPAIFPPNVFSYLFKLISTSFDDCLQITNTPFLIILLFFFSIYLCGEVKNHFQRSALLFV